MGFPRPITSATKAVRKLTLCKQAEPHRQDFFCLFPELAALLFYLWNWNFRNVAINTPVQNAFLFNERRRFGWVHLASVAGALTYHLTARQQRHCFQSVGDPDVIYQALRAARFYIMVLKRPSIGSS
jgi:hypothetical protein